MTTPTPRAALKAIFAQLCGIPPLHCVWNTEPEPDFGRPITSLDISGATNTTPVVVTVLQTAQLTPGASAIVAGVAGNTGANGAFPGVIVDATHVSLTGSVGNGVYAGGGTLAPASPYRWGWLRVKPGPRKAVGWDDLRRTDNGDGTFTMNSVGRRVLSLGFDYFSLDPSITTQADDVLEDLRTKLWHPDTLDTINGISMCVQDVGDIVPLPYFVNGAERSAAHLDMMLVLATSDSANYPLLDGWVREVAGTTAIAGPTATINGSFDITGGT